ncbi:GtrA family protein [Ktedonobacter racemifer]|uniref:GtrA family protein n=1 Tax=Ktedonobacter racemifer DSM 44963 TaxID=485913 RepID=D6TYK6_KTERA|nr:GtrA family protein [Ktedonobacter racemifer]EFH85081.1 GtrA family protein [Ktedonobacter racemifer DSM 44963]
MDEIDQRRNHSFSQQVPPQSEAKRAKSAGSTGFQFLRYCLVGGINTIIDVSVLNALLWRDPSHNVQLLVAYNSVAYASGAVSSFFLNKYWTFRRKQQPTRQEVGRFLISVALEILSNNALLWLAGMALSPFMANVAVWGNTSKLLAVAANAVLSYLLMRFWIFASGTQDRAIPKGASPPTAAGKENIKEIPSQFP